MREQEQLSEFAKSLSNFDTLHLTALTICLLAIIVIPIIGYYVSAANRKRMVWGLLAFAIIQEMVDYSNRANIHGLNVTEDLPLHLCNYSLIIAAIGLAKRKQFYFEFAYLIGTTAALQAMVTPSPTGIDNMTYYITFFIQHALIILFPIWNIVVDQMVTTRGAILRTMLIVNFMILPVSIVNWLTGANYMYLCTKPNTESPFLIGEWPWYLIGLEASALLLMSAACIPMIFLRKSRSTRSIAKSDQHH